jgi:hypothetical protein
MFSSIFLLFIYNVRIYGYYNFLKSETRMSSAWAAAEAGRFRSILLLRRHEKHPVFQTTRMASAGRIKYVYVTISSAPLALETRFSLRPFLLAHKRKGQVYELFQFMNNRPFFNGIFKKILLARKRAGIQNIIFLQVNNEQHKQTIQRKNNIQDSPALCPGHGSRLRPAGRGRHSFVSHGQSSSGEVSIRTHCSRGRLEDNCR